MKNKTEVIKPDHEKEIIEMIKNHPIFSFVDIFVYYKAISRATAYNKGLDKLDSIKEAIYSNKRKGVNSLVSKWLKSENPTLQLAAMRMICDTDEHRRLNQNYTEVTGKDGKDLIPSVMILPPNNRDELEFNEPKT